MSGIAGNDGATPGSRAASRSRGRYSAGALLIAATLSLTQGTACAQNILGIISGLARYHGDYLFGRSRSHVHRSSHHRSAHAEESSSTRGSEGGGSSGGEGRGPDLTPARYSAGGRRQQTPLGTLLLVGQRIANADLAALHHAYL